MYRFNFWSPIRTKSLNGLNKSKKILTSALVGCVEKHLQTKYLLTKRILLSPSVSADYCCPLEHKRQTSCVSRRRTSETLLCDLYCFLPPLLRPLVFLCCTPDTEGGDFSPRHVTSPPAPSNKGQTQPALLCRPLA
jgi:hypothetical protein